MFDSIVRLPTASRMTGQHCRSLAKAGCWRNTSSRDTLIITFLITGKLKGALTINGVERFAKKSACITSTNVGRENQTFGHGKGT